MGQYTLRDSTHDHNNAKGVKKIKRPFWKE